MITRYLAIAGVLLVSISLNQAQAQDEGGSNPSSLPITNSPSASAYQFKPLTLAQQQARFEAEQRTMRLEWNRWIGHSPLRPSANSSYMATSYYQSFYSADRGVLVHTGGRGWYW